MEPCLCRVETPLYSFATFSESDPAFATDESQSARGRNSSRLIFPSFTV
jgi:hypothetical protein